MAPGDITIASTLRISMLPRLNAGIVTSATEETPFAVWTRCLKSAGDGRSPARSASSALRLTSVAPVSTSTGMDAPFISTRVEKWPPLPDVSVSIPRMPAEA